MAAVDGTQPQSDEAHAGFAAGGGQSTKLAQYHGVESLSSTIEQILRAKYESFPDKTAGSVAQAWGVTQPGGADIPLPSLTSFEDFAAWFKSPAATALVPIPTGNNDLSYPMSNYFISSSHNTYLSGNQLYGAATGDAYKNVLVRGCRCLEIDVWDGEHETDTTSNTTATFSSATITTSDTATSSTTTNWNQGETDETSGESDQLTATSTREGSVTSKVTHRATSSISKVAHMVRDRVHRSRSPHNRVSEIDEQQQQVVEGSAGNADGVNPQFSSEKQHSRRIEPRVKHGYTLTKEMPFRAVCQVIRQYAFVATDLPLIISLEVHCNLEQQGIMVEIMKQVFTNQLIDVGLAQSIARDGISVLPSPEALRNKILIKVKWAPDPNQPAGESNNPLDHVATNDSDTADEVTMEELTLIRTTTSGTTVQEQRQQPSQKKKKASKVLAALSSLGVYTRAYHFKSFSDPSAKLANHVYSLSEDKVSDLHSDPHHGPALFDHNRDFLMRVFPSGLRVTSSNVEPCFLWRQGVQMVALNWQSLDKGMMLNEGMFAGSEGWILKPAGFQGAQAEQQHKAEDGAQNDTKAQVPQPLRQVLDLEVEVLAAQNLPLPLKDVPSHLNSMKPYVKLQLHVDTRGPPGQGDKKTSSSSSSAAHRQPRFSALEARLHKLHVKDYDPNDADADGDGHKEEESQLLKRQIPRVHGDAGHGPNPDFRAAFGSDKRPLVRWQGIHDVVDELSFLRIKIHDDKPLAKDDLIAWACLKLSRLQPGLRWIHLLDAKGDVGPGVLLVDIRKTLRSQ